jgi:hypothetical protein
VSVLEHLPQNARVAVIRLRSLGDCVLTTPALALLKAARPDLQIGVIVEPRFQAVFEGNPAVSDILDAQSPLQHDIALGCAESSRRNAQHVDDGRVDRAIPRRVFAPQRRFAV